MLSQFLLFCVVGFFAQLVDGALGMAYGVLSTSILLSFGIPPSVASASVHTAEIVTTGISGFSHAMFRNIDYKLFRQLAIPGIIGSIIGAYLLTKIPAHISKPIVITYLTFLGITILYRALRDGKIMSALKKAFVPKRFMKRKLPSSHARGLIPLGFVGGFADAAGGGGWGGIVTTTLLVQDTTPHLTIGTVSLTEFLITVSSSATFLFTIGISHWSIILGLIVGGAVAAPFAAILVRRIQPRLIMLLVGTVVILTCIFQLFNLLNQ